MISLAILGSTGSIGRQALEMAALHPDRVRITALTAHHNAELLFRQVRQFHPEMAAITGEEIPVPEDLKSQCDWRFGQQGLVDAACMEGCDTVLLSVVGMAGLRAVLAAGKAGKKVLLANKESLVAGGAWVMKLFGGRAGERLLPVDSEHSAIFQSLQGQDPAALRSVLLTASGGPFRTWPTGKMRSATPAQALGHPNWSMGAKITVDCATMFNKGLEIIEACWLFALDQQQIRVLVHPESILHSAVEFRDGTVIGQMGIPDMRLPILYAMTYPEHCETGTRPLDLISLGSMSFEAPDPVRFPALPLARSAFSRGGTAPAVMNAANEVAVGAFLREEIRFGDIYPAVDETLQRCPIRDDEDVEAVFEADLEARRTAGTILAERKGMAFASP